MRSPRARGFTVIELMIVMVMIGIMAAIAAPSLRDLIVRMRIKTAASDLFSAMILARSEAIKRNAVVQIVPVSAADWTQGWSVVEQAGGTVLLKQDPYQNVAFRTANAAYVTAALPNVTYSGTGRETGSAGAGVAVVINSTQYPEIQARCVVLDPSGRPAVRQDSDFNAANGCN